MKKILLTLVLSIVSINVMAAKEDTKRVDAIQRCRDSGNSFMDCTSKNLWKNYQ